MSRSAIVLTNWAVREVAERRKDHEWEQVVEANKEE
jgi:hypothetical protein